jgi:alkylation response protein AidB-like acyl-CoA dehydrogenase
MFTFENETLNDILHTVRTVCTDLEPLFLTRPVESSHTEEVFAAFSRCGLTATAIPESYEGLGLSATSAMRLFQEIATFDLGASVALSVHHMVSGLIASQGSEEQKNHYLPLLAQGKHIGAFALTEPDAGSDAGALKTIADPTSEGGYVLKGEKCYITNAPYASLFIVFARERSPDGRNEISAFIVERIPHQDNPHFLVASPDKKMGGELSPIASLTFAELKIPGSARLGGYGEGFKGALRALAGGRINIAACANGISHAAMSRAVKHLEERKQFGKALIEMQGLQFILADMKIRLEAAELLTWQAAQIHDGTVTCADSRITPSIAKCFATDAAMHNTTDAVQLLGGAGYLTDYRVEQLMRDAKMLQIVEGANQVQRGIIAKGLRSA